MTNDHEIIAHYREQIADLRARIKELEDGACRFNCRTKRQAFEAGYDAGFSDGFYTEDNPAFPLSEDMDQAYEEWIKE